MAAPVPVGVDGPHGACAIGVSNPDRVCFPHAGRLPKTTGKRGPHVTVPITPDCAFPEVQRAALALGRQLARRMPGMATLRWRKKDRGARVFVDVGQAVGSIASAYPVRPTPEATVSPPVTWEELPDVAPQDLTVRTVPARFAAVGDVHARTSAAASSLAPLRALADTSGVTLEDTRRR